MTSLTESIVARAIMQRDLLQSMTEQSKSISVRVTSHDRSVSAEANGLGSLTGLWLGPPATRLETDVLASQIVETAHTAARVAVDRYNLLLKEFMARMDELQKAPWMPADGTDVQSE